MSVPTPIRDPRGEELLGRAIDQARVETLLRADTPVVLVGEAGVGKTTLARAAIRAAGRAAREGGGFATLAWSPLLALERALGRSLAGADTAYAADVATRVVGAGVLLVDDLQWVDPDSRSVVTQLAGRVGLLTCVRRGDPAADAAIAGLPASFVRVDLEPLDEAAGAELARRARPSLTSEAAVRVARRAGGNPLLIGELAQGGEEAATLQAAIRSRLAPLDAPARDAMNLLAVAGRPVPAKTLGSGAGALVSSGLAVLDRDGTVRMRHDLISSAAIDDLTEAERRAVHDRLARRSRDPGDAARHHAAAGNRGAARRKALEAAAAAATPGERVAHLELAAEMSDGAAGQELRVLAAHELVDALQGARALELLGELRGSSRADIALVEAGAFRLEYELTAAAEALERARAAVQEAGSRAADPDGDTAVRLAIEAARQAVSGLRESGEALELGRRALALAERHGLHRDAARAVLGSTRLVGGDLGGTEDLSAGMEEALAAGRTPVGLAIGSQLVFALLRGARHAEGRVLVRRLADTAHAARLGAWELQMAFWASGLAWHSGDFIGATAIWSSFDVNPDDETGADWYEVQALADLGRLDEARIRADRAVEHAKPGEYDLGEALWLAADVAALSGRWADAERLADRHARDVPNAHQRPFVELSGAWAKYELGRAATWPRHSGQVPIMRGAPLELEALRALVEGQHAQAAEAFDVAAEAWAGCHARGELRSRWAAAESLRLRGDERGARTRLLELEERLAAASHMPLLARTRRSLRRVGVRRSAPRAPSPVAFLTMREQQILEMTARGLRDAEIATQLGVSRWAIVRAAESAAAKLGAATRAEAVARAVSR